MTTQNKSHRTVEDYMTGDLIALRPADSVARAKKTLTDTGLHALPIIDGEMTVGVVTLADCELRDETDLLGDTAQRPPVTVTTSASVADAAQLMRAEGVNHLLVTEDSPGAIEVIGIISSFDLLKTITD